MYGLVNKALEKLVVTQFGEDKWLELLKKADVDAIKFVAMSSYPDEVTYKLVGAASELLDTPAEKLLEGFGEYWILYTADEGYGELMSMCGDTVFDFMRNMNALHAKIKMTFSELKPPNIVCEDVEGDKLRVHYHSERPGLAPMFVGLLKGLGKRFSTPVDVIHEKAVFDGADHDEFLVSYQT